MTIDFAAIRAKLAAEKAATADITIPAIKQPVTIIATSTEQTGIVHLVPSANAPLAGIVTAPTPTPTPTTADVMAQMRKLEQNIPADDPKLSAEENYLRQASASEVQDKIQELQERLLSQHPTMPVLLQTIHKLLKQQPDNVTLLSDEQVGVIVSGLLRHTSTEISAKAAGKKTKKVTQKLSLSDLGFD